MADNKNNLPTTPTRLDFPEVKDKTVEIVEVIVEPDRFGISVRFQDKTSLNFTIEPCVFAFPVYEDWTDGEAKVLKQYQPIRNRISTE